MGKPQAGASQIKDSQRTSLSLSPGEAALLRKLLDALQAPSSLPEMTYEEFLAWADEDTLAEWVDGEVIMTSPASRRHQEIGLFLAQTIGLYVENLKLGRVMLPPFQMKLEISGREPDLIFVANEHLERLLETYLDGPADLVIEIISPESAGRDRGDKFYEYARGGVPEFWLIDPQTEWAEFYQLQEERYRLVFEGRQGQYKALALPGFWLRVEWLWQDPLPHPINALGEIAGIAPQEIEHFLQLLGGSE